jgi:transposase
LDTELLKRAFLGWLRGEPDHCSMAAIPTLTEEDAKRPGRERESLVGERTRIINRIKGALARLGIRDFKPMLRSAPQLLETLRTPEGAALPPNTLAELRRDMARLSFVKQQINEVERARLERLQRAPGERGNAMVRLLTRVVGVGVETADMLVQEIFSRNLRDRKAVARYAGLTGAPDESGKKRRERGLAKSGNARVRRGMLQLAWGQLVGQVVSRTNCRCARRDAQDHDCGARPQAPNRAVATGDHWRGAGRPCPSRSCVMACLQARTVAVSAVRQRTYH